MAGQEHVTFLCLIYIIFSRYFVFCVDCSDIEKIHPVAGQELVTFLIIVYLFFSMFFCNECSDIEKVPLAAGQLAMQPCCHTVASCPTAHQTFYG